jgi:hypothetical protein
VGKPQQPELDRSGHTPVDQDSAREHTGRPSAGHPHGTDKGGHRGGGRGGGVPPEQRPPHPT